MYDKDTIKNMERAIQTICKTAVTVWDTLDEDGADLMERLEQTAAAICQHFGLEERVMEEYRSTMDAIRRLEIQTECAMSYHELEEARELTYALCDRLSDPKEIMGHVRTVLEMTEVWYPELAAS